MEISCSLATPERPADSRSVGKICQDREIQTSKKPLVLQTKKSDQRPLFLISNFAEIYFPSHSARESLFILT